MSEKSKVLVELKHLFCALGGKNILSDISMRIEKTSLVVIGGLSGSGKTVLGKIIGGTLLPSKGDMRYASDVRENTGLVSQQHDFRDLVEGGTYYQQRYDNTFGRDLPRVGHYFKEELNNDDFFREILTGLRVEPLKDKLFLELSNGESKRVQLALILLQKPSLLILDNPFVGLDKETRAILYGIIELLTQRDMSILLLCGMTDLPQRADQYYLLEGGKLQSKASREELLSEVNTEDRNKSGDERITTASFAGLKYSKGDVFSFVNAVEMKKVSVRYGNKVILHDINWVVKKGECWALTGPNGSGKSTLLSLINGDNPKAYTNQVLVFDKQRGSGESIWELKSKIGYVSPELHLFFQRSPSFTEALARTERRVPGLKKLSFSCLDCITSGFHEQIGWSGTVTSHQKKQAMRWMKTFQIQDLAEQPFSAVSLGMQRVVLLARALVKDPPLLILDEPCQGLDEIQIERFRQIVDMVCTSLDKTLIYVAHYDQHIPSCVTRRFNLSL